MTRLHVLEGTWEERKLHEKELAGTRFRPVPLLSERERPASIRSKSKKITDRDPGNKAIRQLTGMVKFACIIPRSEDFMRQKQEVIELDERIFHT